MAKYTNFNDIPKRLKAYYQIDCDYTDLDFLLKRYKEHFNLDLNPDFQRGHVWTEQQQIDFVEYLLTEPDKDKSTMLIFNCPGWMGRDWKHEMVCIDGLQRCTAMLRFLNNEIPAYGTYYKDYEGYLHGSFTVVIGNFHKRSDILKWYLAVNAKGTPHTDKELARVQKLLDEAGDD